MNLTENVFRNSPFGFSYGKVILDDQGCPSDYHIESINKEFEHLAEIEPADIKGKKASEIDFFISFRNMCWKRLIEQVSQNEGKISEKMFSSSLNTWFLIQAWLDEKEYLAISFIDLSALSEDAGIPTKDFQQFREIFDRVPHSVFIINVTENRRFVVNDFNEIQTEYLNMDRDDIQGKYVEDIFPDGVAESIIEHYLDCVETGMEITYEEDVRLPGRGRRQYLTTLSPIKNQSGEIYRLVGSSIEITDRKKAEESLKKSEEQYRSFVQNSSEGIHLIEFTDPIDLNQPHEEQIKNIYATGYISACNDVMAKMYGYDKSEDLTGKDLIELHGSDNNPENIAYLKNVIDHNFRLKDQLSVEKNVDDNEVYFMNNVYGIIEDDKLVRVWASQRDITEQKEAEELIYKASQKLEESLSEKETLLSEIHHRVKNNLAVVSGMMQLQAFDTTNKELQAKLFDSVIRIKTMASVHELLYQSNSFSRLDFSDTITKLVENISGTLQTSTQIDLDIHCDHIKLNINKAIPASLIVNEVITNIYKHAFDDMTEGEIVFRVTQVEDDILINIKDNGVGFDEDEVQNLSSLGMHLIKELTNQIDGRYEYNTSQQGTEFILQFTK